MRKAVRFLYLQYRAHHDMERPLLQWIGAVGCVAFPLFYLLRRTSALPQLYDDLWLRVVASLLCLGLASRRVWPLRLKPFYIGYSYATVFYCLSFLLSFTMLKNQGGTPSVVNMVMGAILIILLADWRNTVVMLIGGYVVSSVAYILTEADPHVPPVFLVSAAGSLLVVVAGALSHHGQKRAELNRLHRIYSGLAGSIAHEVRTPLGQLLHSLDTIAALVPANAEVASALAQGRRAARRGLQSISITLQQLNEKALDSAGFQDLLAARCVQKAVDEYAYENPQEREKVAIHVRQDFAFLGDETAFELVLFNLLKNALYYLPTHPNSSVQIRVECAPVPRVIVRDHGPGIAPDLIDRLFEQFQSVGKAEGTGLGLAFCRRVMRAFGGDIACRSAPGDFTEFILTFPAAREARDEDGIKAGTGQSQLVQDSAPLAGRKILVVDDSALNRAIARARLVELGASVSEASHAAEALRMLQDGPLPDAILMDMNMPSMDGAEATCHLRAQPGLAEIPVLAVTANPSTTVREAAFAAGMNGFLLKPLQPALLCSELVRLLRGRTAEAAFPLLDAARLAQLRSRGLLPDLVTTCVEEINLQCAKLQVCVAAEDLAGAQQALHGLLGISGDAGAVALFELTQKLHQRVLAGDWPPSSSWSAELERLAMRTTRAIREQSAEPQRT